MTEKTKNATAAMTAEAKNTAEEATTLTELRLSSQVFIPQTDGSLRVEGDGEFVLEVTAGVVTGTHSHPSPHRVSGNLLPTANIILTSEDGRRIHTGILVGNQFIGLRRPLRPLANFDQEEGVWVGTKVG